MLLYIILFVCVELMIVWLFDTMPPLKTYFRNKSREKRAVKVHKERGSVADLSNVGFDLVKRPSREVVRISSDSQEPSGLLCNVDLIFIFLF